MPLMNIIIKKTKVDNVDSDFRSLLEYVQTEGAFFYISSELSLFLLKCYYDQILDIRFFTFSCTIRVSKISC